MSKVVSAGCMLWAKQSCSVLMHDEWKLQRTGLKGMPRVQIRPFVCWIGDSPYGTQASNLSSKTSDDGVLYRLSQSSLSISLPDTWWTSCSFPIFFCWLVILLSVFFSTNDLFILSSISFQDIYWFSLLFSAVTPGGSHFCWHVLSKTGHDILIEMI